MIRENHLVFQAKSFYNAYIALEQISRQSEDDLLLLIPTIVNGAFSCELTLKAILAKNKCVNLIFRGIFTQFDFRKIQHLTGELIK